MRCLTWPQVAEQDKQFRVYQDAAIPDVQVCLQMMSSLRQLNPVLVVPSQTCAKIFQQETTFVERQPIDIHRTVALFRQIRGFACL